MEIGHNAGHHTHTKLLCKNDDIGYSLSLS